MAEVVAPRHHTHRRSSRRSLSTAPHLGPVFESPRTLCPRDTDAFSYDPAHLKEWYMPQELWNGLPSRLQKPLAALQHAGAAVLTGFDRLALMRETLPSLSQPLDSDDEALEDHSTAAHDALAAKLLDHQRKSSSNSQPRGNEDYFPCSPILPERHHANSFGGGSSSTSGSTTRSNSTSVPSPHSALVWPDSPVSPFVLSPTSPTPVFPSRRMSTTKFAHHHDTPMAQYLAELHNLRHEMLVRLRHAVRRVETEWRDVKRLSSLAESHTYTAEDDDHVDLEPQTEKEFEHWWLEKKNAVHELTHRGNALGRGLHVSLGWGGHGGMGWA
jgi:hypothetical protein